MDKKIIEIMLYGADTPVASPWALEPLEVEDEHENYTDNIIGISWNSTNSP